MLISATAKIRNGLLYKFRSERQLTQKVAAELAGVGHTTWCATECMNFKLVEWGAIKKIANLLDVTADEICPEELRKKDMRLTREAYREMSGKALLPYHEMNRQKCLPEETIDSPIDSKALVVALDDVLRTLTSRERQIIELRNGLNGNEELTCEETAKVFKVTRERVRQVEAKAMNKLRHPTRARRLAEFVDVDSVAV